MEDLPRRRRSPDEHNLAKMNPLKDELYAAYRHQPDAPPAALKRSRHLPR